MKKRFYALLLCLLLLAAFPLTALAAQEPPAAPELTICEQREGGTLTVTVGIAQNPGIAGFDVALHFDSAALTPVGDAQMAEGWERFTTNYAEPFSGDTLRVVAANSRDICGDCELFTVRFAVKGEGNFGLYAEGTACTEREERVELSSAYTDALTVSAERTEGGVTVAVTSYGGSYRGEATAILACYQDGQFVGCAAESFTIAPNAQTSRTLPLSGGAGATFRLMLVDASFAPLCEAADIPA